MFWISLALAAPARVGPEPKLRGFVGALGGGSILLFLRVSPPHRRQIPSFAAKADSSLIHLFTFLIGQQVSKDTRSRLEHCTLEELLTDDKVIFV